MAHIPPWEQTDPKEVEIVFVDKNGNKLTLVAVEDGDDGAALYLGDVDVTRSIKAMLGKSWIRTVTKGFINQAEEWFRADLRGVS